MFPLIPTEERLKRRFYLDEVRPEIVRLLDELIDGTIYGKIYDMLLQAITPLKIGEAKTVTIRNIKLTQKTFNILSTVGSETGLFTFQVRGNHVKITRRN